VSRVTIGDVAAEAGVSVATVSKVINGRYGVAPATLAKVQAVIDDLGYESSLVARSLRSRRTNVVGILVADIEPFSAELLKEAQRAAADRMDEVIDDVASRLRIVEARLGEALARVVELAAPGPAPDNDLVVSDLEALAQALDEVAPPSP